MKPVLLAMVWLIVSVAAVAQSYSNASVNGAYSIQVMNAQYDTWSKTFTCPTNSSVTYTPTGSTTTMSGVQGTATFDGAGNVTFTVLNFGKLNQTASANTMSVTWNSSCQVTNVNTGHVVYQTAATQTGTGTYSIKSNGSGTLTIKGTTGAPLLLQLAAANSSGISDTVLLTSVQTNGSSIGSGIAVHQ